MPRTGYRRRALRLVGTRKIMAIAARKHVPADRREAAHFVKVHVVRDPHHVGPDADQVERVLFALARSAPPRGRRAGLHDDDAAGAVLARIHVQRVADIGPVQMTAQDQVDLQLA